MRLMLACQLNSDLAYKLARTCTDSTIYNFPSNAREIIFVGKHSSIVTGVFPIGCVATGHSFNFGGGTVTASVQINDTIYRFTSFVENGTEYIGNGAILEVWYR